MTRSLLAALPSACPVVAALEGGYALSIIPRCFAAVLEALLGDPPDPAEGPLDDLGFPRARLNGDDEGEDGFVVQRAPKRMAAPPPYGPLLPWAAQDIDATVRAHQGHWAPGSLATILEEAEATREQREAADAAREDAMQAKLAAFKEKRRLRTLQALQEKLHGSSPDGMVDTEAPH